jgi:hypothetical protein
LKHCGRWGKQSSAGRSVANEQVLIVHAGTHGAARLAFIFWHFSQQPGNLHQYKPKMHIHPPTNELNFTNERASPMIRPGFASRETASAFTKSLFCKNGAVLSAKT